MDCSITGGYLLGEKNDWIKEIYPDVSAMRNHQNNILIQNNKGYL